MDFRRLAAWVYAVVSAGAAAFQVALALGAPWGAYAMGGTFPGQFPPALRAGALVQAAVLLFFAGVVLARSGIAFRRLSRVSRWLAWVVVAFAAVSFVLNLITPSAGERMIWAPVGLVLLVCSLLVATRHDPKGFPNL
ncbi:MAG: hypothetical protein K1X65_10050 [Caldilineales bacterium]|nr:hypothetical protein [Caldilineales bacterium]